MSQKKSPFRYKIIRTIGQRIQSYSPEKVIVFGSYARGEVDDLSDVDIVVIKKTREIFFDRIRKVLKVLNLDRAVDVFVYTPEEFDDMIERGNAFAEMILEEGVVIYER